ncbi:hypothetical protein [Streptomyces pini]|uniref:Uncharacterized protein n=1 Tax=Streptomyces pini TaxID=1520580 RepID=A0A1I3U390_9ACTN|nr:hypothetical protein [Streptomyces pini]SFJ77193.1 hypothetical protein SAMN05192584_101249 [Streptomyces pini]
MSETTKKIVTGGPQRDNHMPSPGEGGSTPQEPTTTETAPSSETQVTEENSQ